MNATPTAVEKNGRGAVPLSETDREARDREAAEAKLRERLAAERARLEAAAGTSASPAHHFRRQAERLFTADQRKDTTILFGGLTWKHEKLVHGGLEGLGYKVEILPVPDVRAFQLGKEYGNNGQCNPTYFTVGNLVQFLQRLEEQGAPRREIEDRYVFFTAGACGPCRFGMYEAEYRLALRNAGFEQFRVLLFQQSAGLNQAEVEAGLEMNLDFFLAILNALSIGDLLNEIGYQIRPYEVNPGDTDRALDEIMDDLHETLRAHKPFLLEGWKASLARSIGAEQSVNSLGKFLTQAFGDELTAVLRRARARLDAIPVDRLRVKPIVKITGEFWAQTTEGDGNFKMFSFLEREGAQVLVEPIATWICYMIHGAQNKIRDRKGLEEGLVVPSWRDPIARLRVESRASKRIRKLKIARRMFVREYERYRKALGGQAHELADQLELERIAHPFYNSRAGGGEGHLEVAKNVYYHNKDLCHMVLSLKPFGCMPSTQSDGVQSAIVSQFPEMIYLPIETSGEGEINAHSRVQMALGEAKAKAKAEFQQALESTGKRLDQIRTFVAQHPELSRPMYRV
ncbi:MAG: activator of (R)-2-hydroxyglutaryl-CoA dehydratase, partial [Candidatus Eisenbacteria bacterium]|nr:activator of (R)-2-hydroxyglutaryl-CoA dehydratase [Candidatus Eisenbacteria bacterium]